MYRLNHLSIAEKLPGFLKHTIKLCKPRKCELFFFGVGIFLGCSTSLIFEPVFKMVIYGSIIDASFTALEIVLMIAAVKSTSSIGRQVGVPRDRLLKCLFLGVSLTSFVLAGINIVTLNRGLREDTHGWITPGVRPFIFSGGSGEGGIYLSSIIYYIAKILWSIFLGSFFAVLDRFFAVADNSKQPKLENS